MKYSIALGSTREVQAILDLNQKVQHFSQADQLGAMIYKLIQNPGGC